jgi:hypothetical protein
MINIIIGNLLLGIEWSHKGKWEREANNSELQKNC